MFKCYDASRAVHKAEDTLSRLMTAGELAWDDYIVKIRRLVDLSNSYFADPGKRQQYCSRNRGLEVPDMEQIYDVSA
jgi:hypothetical protein